MQKWATAGQETNPAGPGRALGKEGGRDDLYTCLTGSCLSVALTALASAPSPMSATTTANAISSFAFTITANTVIEGISQLKSVTPLEPSANVGTTGLLLHEKQLRSGRTKQKGSSSLCPATNLLVANPLNGSMGDLLSCRHTFTLPAFP